MGGVGPHRGVDTLIRSASYLGEPEIDILIEIVGARPNKRYTKMLKELINELNIDTNVKLIPWIKSDDVYEYMRSADVGIVPHHSNDHTDTTIPHKLYQYMMAGLPLIVSSSKPLKRVVETLNCGVIYEAGNPRDLADKIKWLFQNRSQMARMAENGFNSTVKENVNWENNSALALLHSYSQITKK